MDSLINKLHKKEFFGELKETKFDNHEEISTFKSFLVSLAGIAFVWSHRYRYIKQEMPKL